MRASGRRWCAFCLLFLGVEGTAAAFVGDDSSTSREELPIARGVATLPTGERPLGLAVNGDGDVSKSRISGAMPATSAAATTAASPAHRTKGRAHITRSEKEDSLVEEGGDDGKPKVTLSTKEWGEGQPPLQEEEDEDGGPGEKIEEMAEDWAERASTRAAPGAVLENARSVYSEISDEILTRWGYKYANTPLFSGGMRFSDGGTVVENKFLNAVLEQEGFVAAFTGVSTTAGHDCLYEQSFPIVLNKTMGKLMAAAGVRFEAINVAMGNTRVAPYSYCVDAHAGLDADIISWDMSLMVASLECGLAAKGVELFIRSASVLPKRPAVLLTDANPDQELCTNGHLRQIEKLDRSLTGDCIPDRDLFQAYRDFGVHQISPRSLVPEITCGDDVFARGRLYNNTEKDSPRTVRWHAGPTGHVLVGDMLFMHYAAVFMKALERLDGVSPGITAAGLRQHDALFGTGRNSLRESLGLGVVGVTIAADRGGGSTTPDNNSDESANAAAAYMGGGRGDILPPPVWCKGWRFCDWAGSYRCANTYFPLAGKGGSRLLEMLSERTPAVLNRNRSENFVEPSPGRWAITLNEEARGIKYYLKMPSPDGFHHPIDMKWVLVGDKDSGPIEFEFETAGFPAGGGGRRRRAAMVDGDWEAEEEREEVAAHADPNSTRQESGNSNDRNGNGDITATTLPTSGQGALFDSRITVCKPDFIDRVAFNESSEVRFSVDGVQVSIVELVQAGLHPQSCVLLDAEVGVGRHTVKVEPLMAGEPYVAISHVLYPA